MIYFIVNCKFTLFSFYYAFNLYSRNSDYGSCNEIVMQYSEEYFNKMNLKYKLSWEISFTWGLCRQETSQLICSVNLWSVSACCGFLLRGISEWTILFFNSSEQLLEEYSKTSIHHELFYKNMDFVTHAFYFLCTLYLWLEPFCGV